MTMAAAIESRTAEAKAWSKASRIASVDVVSDLGQAETIWRRLEAQFSTAYQRFDFLAAWQRQVGEREGNSPFIVIAYDGDRRPLLLLPLALRLRHGFRTACFMGGKHTTFNLALWDLDFAASAICCYGCAYGAVGSVTPANTSLTRECRTARMLTTPRAKRTVGRRYA